MKYGNVLKVSGPPRASNTEQTQGEKVDGGMVQVERNMENKTEVVLLMDGRQTELLGREKSACGQR